MTAPRRTLIELYTPENIDRAARLNFQHDRRAKIGLPDQIIRELSAVKRLHALVRDGLARIAYGVTLRPTERKWRTLLDGLIVELRATMGAEEAAVFFVRHLVCPVASQLRRRDRLKLAHEMREMPFSECGKPLGEHSAADPLLSQIEESL
jgi:hypothetical protein